MISLQNSPYRQQFTLNCIAGITMALVVLSALLQIIAFPDAINIYCCLISVVGAGLATGILLKNSNFPRFTWSATAILFFAIQNFIIPVIWVNFEWRSLIYRLNNPLLTFALLFATLVTLLLAHVIYKASTVPDFFRSFLTNSVYAPLGLFRPLSNAYLWCFGLIGLGATIFGALAAGQSDGASPGIVRKVADAFEPFVYAPFLIPISVLFRRHTPVKVFTWICLGVLFIMLVGAAIFLAARGKFAIAVLTIGGCFLVACVCGLVKFERRSIPMLVGAGIVIVISFWQLTELAWAIRLEGKNRNNLGYVELTAKTVETFLDKEKLKSTREALTDDVFRAGQWDERYFSNEIVQRLSGIKYHDNGLTIWRKLSPARSDMMGSFLAARVYTIFPDPVLKFFDIRVNKTNILSLSVGDYLAYLYTGKPYAGFRTGSMVASGLVAHGGWFFVYLFFLSIGLFILVDSLILTPSQNLVNPPGLVNVRIVFSLIPLMFFNEFAFLFYKESIENYALFVFRKYIQIILLYAITMYGIKVLFSFIGRGKQA